MAKLFRVPGTNRVAMTATYNGVSWTFFGVVNASGGEISSATDNAVDLTKEGYAEIVESIPTGYVYDPKVQKYLGRIGVTEPTLGAADESLMRRMVLITQKYTGEVRASVESLTRVVTL